MHNLFNKELLIRSISAAVLIPLVIYVTFIGGAVFDASILLMGFLMLMEWHRMWGDSYKITNSPYFSASCIAMLLTIAGISINSLFLPTISIIIIAVFHLYNRMNYKTLGWQIPAGFLYVIIPTALLVIVRDEKGFATTMWLFACVWGVDIGAYFAGRIIGGPKIAPSISPKKTWAGLGGGMVAAIIISEIAHRKYAVHDAGAGIAIFLTIIAQAGDFFESYMKRHTGVKDTGNIIPGHGGILDRVDGLIFAVTAYFALSFF